MVFKYYSVWPQIQKQSSKDHNLVSDQEKGGFQLVLYHTQPGIIGFFSYRISNTKEYSQSKRRKVALVWLKLFYVYVVLRQYKRQL